jgi:hypothetical protein
MGRTMKRKVHDCNVIAGETRLNMRGIHTPKPYHFWAGRGKTPARGCYLESVGQPFSSMQRRKVS